MQNVSVLWPESVARVQAQYGTENRIGSLNPQETALLVVDMQKFYLEATSTNFCPAALDIITNINALATAFRDFGAPVIWLRNILGNKDIKSWSSFYDRLTKKHLSYRREKLAKDGDGFQLFEGMDVRSSDRKVNKTRFSAFARDASNIEKVLGEYGTHVLVVCGIVTNVCVESTVRDAMMLNYEVLVAEDACASSNERAHEASINNMYTHFADVTLTSNIKRLLGQENAQDFKASAA